MQLVSKEKLKRISLIRDEFAHPWIKALAIANISLSPIGSEYVDKVRIQNNRQHREIAILTDRNMLQSRESRDKPHPKNTKLYRTTFPCIQPFFRRTDESPFYKGNFPTAHNHWRLFSCNWSILPLSVRLNLHYTCQKRNLLSFVSKVKSGHETSIAH